MKINARKCALDILIDIEKNQAFSNIAINKHLKGKNIELIDQRFIRELVYGVLENKLYLDFIIGNFSKLNKINIKVLNILRMGLYQIIYLDKVPEFAAVNESVNLAKKVDFRSNKFVNGVLRNFLRNKEKIKIPKDDVISYLSIRYSHPKWMVKRWLKEYGKEFTERLLIENNKTPKLSIRTNTLKTTKEELVQKLLEENIEVYEDTFVEEGIYVKNLGNIEKLKMYQDGLFQVQDESSMLVAHVLDPKPEELVMDVCSAPGGKTTHIAQLMKNKGKVLARDIYEHKLKLVRENALRLGITNIKTGVFDATKVDKTYVEKVDKVLVDAPCSGFGIIRRKPEIKYNKTLKDINEISKLQLCILNNASAYVKKGGTLVYSTCTIEKDENLEVVEKFLSLNPNFKIEDINDCLPLKLRGEQKTLQLYPNIHKTDGFFICKLRHIQTNN